MLIRELQVDDITPERLTEINTLLRTLSQDPSTYAEASVYTYRLLLEDVQTLILGVFDESIKLVGIGTLHTTQKRKGLSGYIEDVVVDASCRGKGIGTTLMNALIEAAKERGVYVLELTSRPSREIANKLYQKLGFELRDTNVYSLKL